MPWKPGQSGNPKGRPAYGLAAAEAIRKLAGKDGVKLAKRLMQIVNDPDASHADAIRACDLLYERGYGKVPLASPDTTGDGRPTRVIYEYPPDYRAPDE